MSPTCESTRTVWPTSDWLGVRAVLPAGFRPTRRPEAAAPDIGGKPVWVKLGDEFADAARDLSSPAFRTHVEALLWSGRRGLDLIIPKRDLRRFAEDVDPEKAVVELLELGWWQDLPDDDAWYAGCYFADWQPEAKVVSSRKRANALRVRKNRLHKVDDHSLCDEDAPCRRPNSS